MNNEEKVWFLFSFMSCIAFVTLLITALYGPKFKYEFYVVVLAFGMAYMGIIMFAMTRYLTTKEIVSILMEKIGIKRRNGDKK